MTWWREKLRRFAGAIVCLREGHLMMAVNRYRYNGQKWRLRACARCGRRDVELIDASEHE